MTNNLSEVVEEHPTIVPEFGEGGFTPLVACPEHHYTYTEEVGGIRIDVSTSDGEFMKWYLSEGRYENQG